jgi:ABC-2 type transport system permease protein
MSGLNRYVRLLAALARYSLAREMAFRGNFIARVSVEVIWLGILLLFYRVVFQQTNLVAGWSEAEYLFFVGCFYALGGVMETLFLDNCNSFADLIRSGDLDFYLLRPIDEQFLVTCRNIDWATVPNIFLGSGLMILSLVFLNWEFNIGRVAAFSLMFVCGIALSYSFLVLLMSTSVWLVRNQSLYELWWLFTSLMRYPREIWDTLAWARPVGMFFTFFVPAMLVVSVPSETMVKEVFEPRLMVFTAAATVVLLWASRRFFRFSLRRYRSASS